MKRPWALAIVVVVGDEVVMVSAASFFVFDVAFECAGGSKFTQLVSNHLLGDEHRHMAPAVVNGNGMADHHRQDGGGSRPGFDHRLVIVSILLFQLAKQAVSNEGAFF